MDILMTGYAGLAESRKLAEEHREELLARLPAWLLDDLADLPDGHGGLAELKLISPEQEAADGRKIFSKEQLEISVYRNDRAYLALPIDEGGVFKALWDLAEKVRECFGGDGGLTVVQADIPIRQEIIEVCEVLDLDPYRIASGGFLYLLPSGCGLPGQVIGRLTPGKARIVLAREGTRYLEKPRPREEKVFG